MTTLVKDNNVQSLGIFLRPPSIEDHERRLVEWLSESDEDVNRRLRLAATQERAATEAASPAAPIGHPAHLYDYVLTNDEYDAAYEELVGLVTKYRPDVMAREEEGAGGGGEAAEEAAAAAAAAAVKLPILVLASSSGSPSSSASSMSAALRATFAGKFLSPVPLVTDRKPAKCETSTPDLKFITAKELAALASSGSIVVQYPSPEGAGGVVAVTKEGLETAMGRGPGGGGDPKSVAVVVLPDASAVAAMRQGPAGAGALYAWVSDPSSGDGSEEGMPPPPEGFDLVLGLEAEEGDRVAAARAALSAHVPSVVPPPSRPLVICGPFGTGRRVLLQKLFEALPGRFAVPAVTTTRAPPPPLASSEGDTPVATSSTSMTVVSREEADQLIASGGFLVYEETLGHVYGVTRAAVKKVLTSGKVCVLDLDRVADARRLRDQETSPAAAAGGGGGKGGGLLAGAAFVYVGVASTDVLLKRVHAELERSPPLGYSGPGEAAGLFFQGAKAEVEASRSGENEGLFDRWVDNGPDPAVAFARLAEVR